MGIKSSSMKSKDLREDRLSLFLTGRGTQEHQAARSGAVESSGPGGRRRAGLLGDDTAGCWMGSTLPVCRMTARPSTRWRRGAWAAAAAAPSPCRPTVSRRGGAALSYYPRARPLIPIHGLPWAKSKIRTAPILLKHGSVQSYPLSKKTIRSPKIFAHEFGGPRGPRIFTAHRQAYVCVRRPKWP